MDTNELIDSLSKDLKPSGRIPSPLAGTAIFTVGAALMVSAAVWLMGGPQKDWMEAVSQAEFLREAAVMVSSGILAALAACCLSVPDTRVRRPIIFALALATLGWLYLCGHALSGATYHGIVTTVLAAPTLIKCLADLVLMTAMPLGMVFLMLTRAAPVWRGWAGYAAVLSMTSFGALGMRVFCPLDSFPYLLVWQFAPVLVLSLLGIALGKLALRSKL